MLRQRRGARRTFASSNTPSSAPEVPATQSLIVASDGDESDGTDAADADSPAVEGDEPVSASQAAVHDDMLVEVSVYADPELSLEMSRTLARLALVAEYQRTLIRREDISRKVFDKRRMSAALLQRLLAATNERLRSTFGMELVEVQQVDRLPLLDVAARRRQLGKGRRVEMPGRRQWMAVSVLDSSWRLGVTVPRSRRENEYNAQAMVCLSLVALHGGRCDATYLQHTFRRRFEMPEEECERMLAAFTRDDYLVSARDGISGETFYSVGTRGLNDVGAAGVTDFIAHFYGQPDLVAKSVDFGLGSGEGDP